jgi:hypothetical protein
VVFVFTKRFISDFSLDINGGDKKINTIHGIGAILAIYESSNRLNRTFNKQ